MNGLKLIGLRLYAVALLPACLVAAAAIDMKRALGSRLPAPPPN
jgi:hypothetical protein